MYQPKIQKGLVTIAPEVMERVSQIPTSNAILFPSTLIRSRPSQLLSKSKQSPFPICSKCDLPETVDHYLFSCSRYIKAQKVVQRTLQRENFSILTSGLLLNNSLAYPATKTFLTMSTRLPQFRADNNSTTASGS
jgi:hypothetical protein